MEVYLIRNGKRSGPFTPHQVRTKLDRGTINASDLVWFESLTEPISAGSIAGRIEFSKATEEQKEVIRFLGHRVERGLMLLDAESFIERTATAENKITELAQWKAFNVKMKSVHEWWRNQDTFGVPGGIIALAEELGNIQRSDDELFKRIKPEDLVKRVSHFIKNGWRQDPASAAQINLLSQHGVRVSSGLTKGEASDTIEAIINKVTEGQRRRLTFYNLAIPKTKGEASAMIDAYISANPDAEKHYQQWKADELKGGPPPIGMTVAEWHATLDWASKQHTNVKIALPDELPGADPASFKQLQYIRHMVRAIDERTLQTLTKAQACTLIERIGEEKRAFAKLKAAEIIRNRSRMSVDKLFVILAGIVIALFGFVYLVNKASSPKERPAALAPTTLTPIPKEPQSSLSAPTIASNPTTDQWTPPPPEFVRLVIAVPLYNARGKEVKRLPAGKRLRVVKRAGNEITINYIGDDYTIPAASTELSQ